MRYLYVFLFLSLFTQCEKPINKSSKGWEKTDEIKSNFVFKDKVTANVIRQVIDIAENNEIRIANIIVVFAGNKLYVFPTLANGDCLLTPRFEAIFKYNNRDYFLVFNQDKELLKEFVDLKDMKYYKFDPQPTICDHINYTFRFDWNKEYSKYQLFAVSKYDDIIPEEDSKYFPFWEVVEPEPPVESNSK